MHEPPSVVSAEQVFRENASRIYSLALRMLGNDTDVEDVTAEVLMQVVRKLDTFRGESSLTTWLHRVTVNAALALRRRRAARREHETTRPGEGPTPRRPASPDPVQQAMGREPAGLIRAATERLPTQYREVFVLADVEGLSDPEVAQRLGLSLSAVKSRLHRARLMMREALAPHFGEPAA
ncbi:MAG TPA: sigma-70 family RNA polymerase sigma factor [Gemmataceae bacterium]|nr:sigma-70 family RNA polymerase sigma factor [Gemmataceae bacterium]